MPGPQQTSMQVMKKSNELWVSCLITPKACTPADVVPTDPKACTPADVVPTDLNLNDIAAELKVCTPAEVVPTDLNLNDIAAKIDVFSTDVMAALTKITSRLDTLEAKSQ